MMEIILTVLLVLLLICIIFLVRLLIQASNKITVYEEEVEKLANKSQEIITQYEKWIMQYKSVVNEAYNVMQETDIRGSFEADDEVGNAFKAIKDVVDALQKFTNETITKTETIEQK